MTEPKFEQLRGRTYPIPLEEQLKALETDEDLQRFRESRERLAAVFARGGVAKLVSLDTWQMRSVWPELRDREGR